MLKKIALVGDCLAGGGTEKVHATLSIFFAKNGIEVHNIIFQDIVSYNYSGKLMNLGKMNSKSNYDKLKRLFFLKNYIVDNSFDYIIDFRYRVNFINELLISHWVYKSSPVIFTVHSGVTESYIPKNKLEANLIYKKHTIVTVSNAIEKVLKSKIKGRIITIYNPFDIEEILKLSDEFLPAETNYILAVGRMNSNVKQFDKLIEAFSISNLPKKNIKLIIIGEGFLLDTLKELVNEKGLEDMVVFKGRLKNPHPYQKRALFSVVSSLNEGFGNTIVESLITGSPVISFDCFCGPNEIIINNQNGILVQNQSVFHLSKAMERMIEDQKLYDMCINNAKMSVQRFSVYRIGQEWIKLMSQNFNQN